MRRRRRNAQLFLMVKFLFLSQSGIFERAFACRQGAAVGSMDQSVGMQFLEVLANRNLRGFETPARSSTSTRPSRLTRQEWPYAALR